MASLSTTTTQDELEGLVATLMSQLQASPPEWLSNEEDTTNNVQDAGIPARIDSRNLDMTMPLNGESNTPETKTPIKYKFILAPGNGGCGRNIKAANWYAWFDKEITKRGHESICVNWPDPNICHQSKWIPFCINELKADERTIIVGHSTGALLAMRLAEQQKVAGIILVAAAHTDLGDAGERASGYFDEPWNWAAIPPNCNFIHQFHSVDDPLIPVAEARFVAAQLKGENHVYEELLQSSHFFEPWQELLDAVDRYAPSPSVPLV